MSTFVIYHRADFDGIFSREIARQACPTDTVFIGWDYGDPVPEIPAAADLFMIDISIDELMAHPGLTWIDHHKTAIEQYEHRVVSSYCIDGVAACRLAWQWFNSFKKESLPGKQAYVMRSVIEPLAVRLAGEYDVWDKRDPDADLFQHGLRTCELDFNRLLTVLDQVDALAYVHQLLEGGKALQFARQKENASIIKAQGFTLKWEGLTFLACNAARFNSHLFTAALKPEHDACLGFAWDGGKGKWKVSMYGVPGKPDFDLSMIAVRHGGGGHKQACGFECRMPPFALGAARHFDPEALFARDLLLTTGRESARLEGEDWHSCVVRLLRDGLGGVS